MDLPHLPRGTVTFLFTDVEGSTILLQILGDARYADVQGNYERLLRTAVEAQGGVEVESHGDGFLFAFGRMRDAILAVVESQKAIGVHSWPAGSVLRVRMGLHTGEPVVTSEGYVGLDVHRAARICEAGWGGQILLSPTTAQMLEHDSLLGVGLKDLGEHRLKSLDRPERLFQLLHPDLPVAFPPLRSATVEPHNLPRSLTSFIGREREMAEIRQLLSAQRLIALVGPPGCGKTRLAVEVATTLVAEYHDGVRFVDFARLSDAALIVQEVASALGLRDAPAFHMRAGLEQPARTPLDALLDYVKDRRLLLVLDNCEHVIDASARLADALLRRCPHLRIMATSQAVLGIAGESLYPVAPLQAPDPTSLPGVDDLLQYSAVRLFVERAIAALPHFRLTAQNARAVAQICHRLDGISLAIELAAARLRILPVDQIAARLDDMFRFLTVGSRTVLPRHQTLRAAIDWAYGLLSASEQALLRRLAVFVGGFTLEGAEAVGAGHPIEPHEVLDLLAHLQSKSLVVVEARTDEFRYRLLQTIRQYGLERLQESGETAQVRERHRDWFLRLAEHAAPELHGEHQAAWYERLTTEHDNLRAALQWSLDCREVDHALRLVLALVWFWYVRGFLGEGRAWTNRALSADARASPGLRALVMARSAVLAWAQADYGQAQALCEESRVLARASGNRSAAAHAAGHLGLVAHRLRNYAAAAALYEESLAKHREVGDTWSAALVLLFLSRVILHLGDHQRADVLFREGLALSHAQKDSWSMAHYLYESADAARRRGELDQARALFEESLARFQEVGSKEDKAYAHNMLGRVAYAAGDYPRAAAHHEESLRLARETGDRAVMAYALYHAARAFQRTQDPARAAALYRESLALRAGVLQDVGGAAECLVALAQLGWLSGRRVDAARFLGAADRLRELAGAAKLGALRETEGRDLGTLRDAVLQPPLAQAWAEGQAMTLEEIATFATNV